MSDSTLASKNYVDTHFGEEQSENTLVLASKEYVDAKPVGPVYPENSNVFFYKDNDGKLQGFDTTNATTAANVFENNTNIGPVEWRIDMPNLTSATSMFAGSSIKSFDANIHNIGEYSNTFANCANLQYVKTNFPRGIVVKFNPSVGMYTISTAALNMFKNCISLTDAELYNDGIVGGQRNTTTINLNGVFSGCTSLKNVYIFHTKIPSSQNQVTLQLTNMFENCTSLETFDVKLKYDISGTNINATNMFSGCLIDKKLLEEIFNCLLTWEKKGALSNITIGIDSTVVDPAVDVIEDESSTYYGKTFDEAFTACKWTVTWQYNTPAAKASAKLMAKTAPVKFYKLDEIDEELLEYMENTSVYTKDGKYYLVTFGDLVTSPGLNDTILRNTEIENVVEARSLEEAVDILGVKLIDKQ